MSKEGMAYRNALVDRLEVRKPVLATAIRRCLPSSHVEDDRVLVLRFGPGARFDYRIATQERAFLLAQLAALSEPAPMDLRLELRLESVR